ncbi:MAG: hypothetical protein JXR03_17865 [Cyclobacteriaceae bacterium]
MILVGDAGGTKTDWRIIDGDRIIEKATKGFNAAIDDPTSFISNTQKELYPFFESTDKVYLYAAGAATLESGNSFSDQFSNLFQPTTIIEIQNDLVAAGRALFGHERGMVGILGTGSALGMYETGQVKDRVPSLGYALGDEGSGFFLAKKLISSVLRGQFPAELKSSFLKSYPDFSEKNIIEAVYRQPNPNRNLAAYTHFLNDHINHPFIFELVFDAFKVYFQAFNLSDENKEKKWRFSGSVAFYFEEILKKAGSDFDLYIDKIIQSPVEELARYHQQNG